ncbi:MAG: helicase-related protein [Pseudomonadota bacterium]|nr:helicase-related protein [Pseudomonadota bacterium]
MTIEKMKLEDIKKDQRLKGIEGDSIVTIVSVDKISDTATNIIYRNSEGQIGEQLLQRSDEARICIVNKEQLNFSANGKDFQLALEAQRIRLAHLFDPMMAVHTSDVEPLPHQISAVYEAMLPRQPLRFVLADDPGAGKTIMAGLFMRELIMRADAQRILIITPGSLSEQWQDELQEKFTLEFEIFSRERQEKEASKNFFDRHDKIICRLDQLARNELYLEQLTNSEYWDLVIVDEAHKMSAHYYGNKLEKSKRYNLGEAIGKHTRHLLLMTATPHNGKEEDFQLFLALLDSDRFYGKFRDGAHKADVHDIMRRMVKEELLKFDGTKLFPERKSFTVGFALSKLESILYSEVTEYVRDEMNRADQLDENNKRKRTVGFALTLLQRRLASSPQAIHHSLQRRHKRLEQRLNEEKLSSRGREEDIPDDFDDEDFTAEEREDKENKIVDAATAARTVEELQYELNSLKQLELRAKEVVDSGEDCKWVEVRKILMETPEMKNQDGLLRKVIIFTEHRDTLEYLVEKIADVLGSEESIVTIHGGTRRDLRRRAQEEFRNNADVRVLIATDAAGEGVNLQNANLMINYDLPWNPNRLEQRFGRIHRIGQTEVCYLWNLIAKETREGQVLQRLFDKIATQSKALGGKVYDVLGEVFAGKSLQNILIEAIRYGDTDEARRKLTERIDNSMETKHLRDVMRRTALVEQHMSIDQLYTIKEEMDKAEARKLQPYFVKSFFRTAFEKIGGKLISREKERWEIRHVPAEIRQRDRIAGEKRTHVTKKYERICFEKEFVRCDDKPIADFVHHGHPLMAATTDIILEKFRPQLQTGAVLINSASDSITPHIIFMLEHAVKESTGKKLTVSQVLRFVAIDANKQISAAGYAPHLDLRSPTDNELIKIKSHVLGGAWLAEDLEGRVLEFAAEKIVPEHYREVKTRREQQIDKIDQEVHKRLTREINFWTDRHEKLKEDFAAGKQPRMQPENAKRRVEEIDARLKQRRHELATRRNVVSIQPRIIGSMLVVPAGLLAKLSGANNFSADSDSRKRLEQISMNAVRAREEATGNEVFDVSAEKCGWDITSRPPSQGEVIGEDRHIEVKARAKGQDTITVTKNEILTALNQREKFILAIVIVDGENYEGPYYIREPFERKLSDIETSTNLKISELLKVAE